MGVIRNALIGIALYEAVSYVLKNRSKVLSNAGRSSLGGVDYSRIASEEEFRPIQRRGNESQLSSQTLVDGLAAGTNPEAPLTGTGSVEGDNDTWKNSLANDELRAPDS